MSLSAIINAASAAIAKTQYNISVTNTNVSNASDTNYARQSFTGTATTSTLALSNGAIARAGDVYLNKTVLNTTSSAAAAAKTSSYLQSYDAALGSVSGGDDVSTLLNNLQTALTTLANSPSSASAQTQAVSAANTVAQKLNALSGALDALQTQSAKEAQTEIANANQLLTQISQLNDQIVATNSSDGDTASLEDARDAALKSLAGTIGVQSYDQADGRVSVYTSSGQQLVGATASQLSMSTNASAILVSVNGNAVDANALGGELGALATLHNTTLATQSDKLDQIASGLIDAMNAVANAGASLPAPQTLTGTRAVSGASEALDATGTVRIAAVDASGAVVSSQDLNLSAYATVGDLVAALNGVSGVSATIIGGQLTISATNSANGIAIAGMDGAVGASAQSFSAYFGLNDVFTGADAGTIAVRSALTSGASTLGVTALNSAASLNVGAIGLNASDPGITGKLVALLDTSRTFSALGSASPQTSSLQTLASSFVSNAASLINSADNAATQAGAVRDAAQTRLSNLTGVNLDEETAYLTQLQTQYQANAQLISTARDLFNTLITMLNA